MYINWSWIFPDKFGYLFIIKWSHCLLVKSKNYDNFVAYYWKSQAFIKTLLKKMNMTSIDIKWRHLWRNCCKNKHTHECNHVTLTWLFSEKQNYRTTSVQEGYHSLAQILKINAAWKVFKYGVFSGPHFLAFGLNTERSSISLCIQYECGKMQTRITPNIRALFTQCQKKKMKMKKFGVQQDWKGTHRTITQ